MYRLHYFSPGKGMFTSEFMELRSVNIYLAHVVKHPIVRIFAMEPDSNLERWFGGKSGVCLVAADGQQWVFVEVL